MSQHGGGNYHCDECDFKTKHRNTLYIHINAVHKGIKYYRHKCAYTSTRHDNLKVHIVSVHQAKPYECDICHARFTQSNSLKAHRSIHTGEKPVYRVVELEDVKHFSYFYVWMVCLIVLIQQEVIPLIFLEVLKALTCQI